MRMTPRERVRAALSHQIPDRVPFSWGFGPTPEMGETLKAYCSARGLNWTDIRDRTRDTIWAGPDYTGPAPVGGNTFVGIWGIHTKSVDYGSGAYAEFTDFPLAGCEGAARLDAYPWPDPTQYDYASMAAQLSDRNPGMHRAFQYFAGNPFEIYCWMTGLEEALVNLMIQPDLVRRALEWITGFFEERLRRTLRAAPGMIDIVFFADDLGSQTGLLMSRETYRAILQPFHRRLTACVRAHAPQAFCMLHSDGAVFDVIPDLLEAGFDVLEAVQTDAVGMDPARLKAAYGERLAFHGAVSVQQLLPHASLAGVKEACRQLVAVLGEGGGYVAAPAHAIQVGTPPENVFAMLEAILEEDVLAQN